MGRGRSSSIFLEIGEVLVVLPGYSTCSSCKIIIKKRVLRSFESSFFFSVVLRLVPGGTSLPSEPGQLTGSKAEGQSGGGARCPVPGLFYSFYRRTKHSFFSRSSLG